MRKGSGRDLDQTFVPQSSMERNRLADDPEVFVEERRLVGFLECPFFGHQCGQRLLGQEVRIRPGEIEEYL